MRKTWAQIKNDTMGQQHIYVVVAKTVQVAAATGLRSAKLRNIIQPPGRQIAQACHAVSLLRSKQQFVPITTIILQARDSKELNHVYQLLEKKRLHPRLFLDTNREVYGDGIIVSTSLAVYANKEDVDGILDYLPLWGD